MAGVAEHAGFDDLGKLLFRCLGNQPRGDTLRGVAAGAQSVDLGARLAQRHLRRRAVEAVPMRHRVHRAQHLFQLPFVTRTAVFVEQEIVEVDRLAVRAADHR